MGDKSQKNKDKKQKTAMKAKAAKATDKSVSETGIEFTAATRASVFGFFNESSGMNFNIREADRKRMEIPKRVANRTPVILLAMDSHFTFTAIFGKIMPTASATMGINGAE